MHRPVAEAGVNEGSRGINRRFHVDDLDCSIPEPGEKDGFADFDRRFPQCRGSSLAHIRIRLAEEGNPFQSLADEVTRRALRLIQQTVLGQGLKQAVACGAWKAGGALHICRRNSPSRNGHGLQNSNKSIQMHFITLQTFVSSNRTKQIERQAENYAGRRKRHGWK